MILQSAPFSFVKLEHPQGADHSLDQPYSLPVFGAHNTAFQFVVLSDEPITKTIRLGIGTTIGAPLFLLAPQVPATILQYRYRLNGLLNYQGGFDLVSITFNGVTATFNQFVSLDQFSDLVYEEYGWEVNGDFFLSTQVFSVVIVAKAGTYDTTFSGPLAPLWHQGYLSVQGVTLVGTPECFSYTLIGDQGQVYGYSNAFHQVSEEAYTSLVSYSCQEEAFGFVYPGATNRIRLPFYLLRPSFPKKREVYRKSNGASLVLHAMVEKEYELTTEQMPEAYHEAMTMMLSHDTVEIRCVNVREKRLELIESENYSVQWESEEERYPLAKGKGKIKVAAYGYNNSNC